MLLEIQLCYHITFINYILKYIIENMILNCNSISQFYCFALFLIK